ncbi:MAG TPA: CHAD domain-containing protein [Pirellulales bacterium]|jgi:CHAD domain-containing protein|nr:CHAD domain-containing protein [Pirellulales bacterium]
MVRKTKWIETSAADDPVDEVARHALEGRLDFVWHFLSRAAAVNHQPEDVHQLRVATRRATAALQTFRALLPRRRARKMKKQLKRIRLAAGDARDLDVLAARLEKDRTAVSDDASIAKLLHFVTRLREQAQPAIEKLYDHLSSKDRFARRTQAILAWLRDRSADDLVDAHTFVDVARHDLSPLVERFFTAAAADLSQPDALHRLRICGKRVRYAMEIFGGAFGPEMREEIYPIVAEIQDKLGKINDHVTAGRLYAHWRHRVDEPDVADLLHLLIAEEHRSTEQGRHDFLAWWTAGRSADLRDRFEQRFAGQPHGQTA